MARPATAVKGEVREGGNERKEQRKRHRVRQRPSQDPEGSEAPAPPHASGCMAPRKPGPEVRKESPLSKPCPGPGDLKFSRAKHCGKRRLSNHMIRHSLSYLFPASGFPPLANRTEQSWGGRGRGAVHRGGKHPNLSDCRGLGPGRGDGGGAATTSRGQIAGCCSNSTPLLSQVVSRSLSGRRSLSPLRCPWPLPCYSHDPVRPGGAARGLQWPFQA